MKRPLRPAPAVAAVVALVVVVAAPAAAQGPDRSEVASALDSAAAAHAADSTVAGLAGAVVHRGDTLLYEGYGHGDLVAWHRALHGGRILSDLAYREMVSPGRLDDGTELRYGMGLAVAERRGRRVFRHSGGINAYLSSARWYPDDDLLVVTLQNSTGPRQPWSLADSLARIVLWPVGGC